MLVQIARRALVKINQSIYRGRYFNLVQVAVSISRSTIVVPLDGGIEHALHAHSWRWVIESLTATKLAVC